MIPVPHRRMRVRLLTDKDEGRRSGSTCYTGQIVTVYPARGIVRHGNGAPIVYWIADADIGLAEGEFELIEESDVALRAEVLMDRHARYTETLVELRKKIDMVVRILTETEHQLDAPRTR